MPALAVLIAPLLALWVKFKLVQFAVKLILFGAIYLSFKAMMDNAILLVNQKIGVIDFPCTAAYILNSLDIFSMINFALSFYAMIFLSKFFYRSVAGLL